MNHDVNTNHNSPYENQSEVSVYSIDTLPLFFQRLPKKGMGEFDAALAFVFFHEGVFSDDKDDAGGATAWGWSLRTVRNMDDISGFDLDFDGDIDIADIKLLKDNPEIAIELYLIHYWLKYYYDRLPSDIAIKTMDMAVNMGAVQAHKLLQRSVWAAGGEHIVDDGIIGKKTLSAIMKCDSASILSAQRAHARGFYDLLMLKDPALLKYRSGWHNRAYF